MGPARPSAGRARMLENVSETRPQRAQQAQRAAGLPVTTVAMREHGDSLSARRAGREGVGGATRGKPGRPEQAVGDSRSTARRGCRCQSPACAAASLSAGSGLVALRSVTSGSKGVSEHAGRIVDRPGPVMSVVYAPVHSAYPPSEF